LDVYSRKIVGFEVHDRDDANHAAHLVKRTALAEGIHAMATKPVLHGDNGATLKATTVLAMLHWLGVKPSYSRPRVSDDNAFVESLFRTAKYRPEFPSTGFADLAAPRTWAAHFVHWYNHEHQHSGIRYVSPAQRHAGQDDKILAARHALYVQARERNPRRWTCDTRDWSPIDTVTLNPEREIAVPTGIKPGAATVQTLSSPPGCTRNCSWLSGGNSRRAPSLWKPLRRDGRLIDATTASHHLAHNGAAMVPSAVNGRLKHTIAPESHRTGQQCHGNRVPLSGRQRFHRMSPTGDSTRYKNSVEPNSALL
jgi:hypothetical protein